MHSTPTNSKQNWVCTYGAMATTLDNKKKKYFLIILYDKIIAAIYAIYFDDFTMMNVRV